MEKSTEETILAVARHQFVQKGFAATRMQEIADEAKINKAMLHYYFRSKEQLYRQIIKETLDLFIPKFVRALEHPGTFWERLERIVSTYIHMLIQHPEIPFFITSELSQKRQSFIDEIKKRTVFFPAIQQFLSLMIAETEAGRIRAVPPFHLFLNVMGMTIFPFIAKPIFCTVFNVSEGDFQQLMEERKVIIMDFLRHALRVD